ncbi:MAG: serine hydrolase [Planctomycetota bacterium]|nr:serine hydrolase [Planctomycetota bacterium]
MMFLKAQGACLFAMLSAVLAFGADAPLVEQPPAASPIDNPAQQVAQVDTLIQQALEKQRIPGLSLAVVKDGQLILAKGYGLANVELHVPATPETVYQMQSITKSFTASGIMLLAEEGKLDLDDKVSQHLDGTPESWKVITVRHLLTHTSGIKDFINEPTASLRLDVSEEDVLKATAARPLNFPPGEQHAYSNTNYHLLAMIIRKLTGQSYGDFLRERIFDPLGMTDTRVISLSDIIPNRAAGYLLAKDGWRNGEFIAPSILGYGGGGLRSTVPDMAKWDAALDTERVLKRAALEQMWTPAKLNNGQTAVYGFGWGLRRIRGHRCVSHTGGHVTGFATVISRFVDDRLTVIMFSNGRHAQVGRLAEQVAGVYVPSLAPPVYQPIEDKEPQVGVRLKEIYASLAEGKPDDKSFTPEMMKVLASQHEQLQQLARTLGPLQSLVLVERADEGELRLYRYRATYQNGKNTVVLSLTKHEAISGLRLEPE